MNVGPSIGPGVSAEVDIKLAPSPMEGADAARAVHSMAGAKTGAVSRPMAGGVAISIVSDSRLLSDGLFTLLSTLIALHPVAHYYTATPQDKSLPNPKGHIVLIDGSMGRQVAQSWARYWRACIPPAHVLVLEIVNDVDLIVDCIEAGVGGYVLKGESVDEVALAIAEVQQGVAKCSPEVTGRLCARLMAAHQLISDLSLSESPLTPRELEVLHYVDQNLSNQEIAALLVIEVRTVKHHVHNILEKLQLNNRREAARHAAKQGWLGVR
jgi:DNA-binding NarL/FixJ family response regulator